MYARTLTSKQKVNSKLRHLNDTYVGKKFFRTMITPTSLIVIIFLYPFICPFYFWIYLPNHYYISIVTITKNIILTLISKAITPKLCRKVLNTYDNFRFFGNPFISGITKLRTTPSSKRHLYQLIFVYDEIKCNDRDILRLCIVLGVWKIGRNQIHENIHLNSKWHQLGRC